MGTIWNPEKFEFFVLFNSPFMGHNSPESAGNSAVLDGGKIRKFPKWSLTGTEYRQCEQLGKALHFQVFKIFS